MCSVPPNTTKSRPRLAPLKHGATLWRGIVDDHECSCLKTLFDDWQIIWFTALFPYVILSVLLVRAVTLEGAVNGLWYYVTPKWDLLLTSGPWIDGATQIFFGYSIGAGALPVLGSYNNFKHNCYRYTTLC